jgi:hypothetical protein
MKRAPVLAFACLSITSLASACDCAGEEPSFSTRTEPTPAPAPEESLAGAIDDTSLAPATRTDLPRALPAITVSVTGATLAVSNLGVLASWPPADRDRVTAAPPEGASSAWPRIETSVELEPDAPIRVPGVVDALSAAVAVERARSGSGAPTVVAMRVTGASPWSSVTRAVYAAGMAGLSEPRFVLASGRDEVELRLTLPRVGGSSAPLGGALAGRDPAELAASIQAALAQHAPAREGMPAEGITQGGNTPRAEIAPSVLQGTDSIAGPAEGEREVARGAPVEAAFTVRLTREGLVVERGGERLGAGCQRAALGPAPSLTMSAITHTSVRECLLASGVPTTPYVFQADPEITFVRVASVLEVLDELGSVSLAM